MNTQIQPYLFFGGRCEEALEFYKITLGAKVEMLMRYQDSPEAIPADRLTPGFENKVMHASFQIAGNTLMASDGCGDSPKFAGFHFHWPCLRKPKQNAFSPRWQRVVK